MRRPSFRTVLRQSPPAIGIAVLAVASSIFGVSGAVPSDAAITRRQAEIENAFSRIPLQLLSDSTWIRRKEVPIPTGQLAILGETAHVSLEYQRLGSSPPVLATLFMVHCRDARSMSGHHPPVCYPASGWIQDGEPIEDTVVLSSGIELLLSGFTFHRGSSGRSLTVVNGFLIPGHGPARFAEDAKESVATLSKAVLGISQFQVLFSGRVPVEDSFRYAGEILGGLDDGLFELLIENRVTDDGPSESIVRRP